MYKWIYQKEKQEVDREFCAELSVLPMSTCRASMRAWKSLLNNKQKVKYIVWFVHSQEIPMLGKREMAW